MLRFELALLEAWSDRDEVIPSLADVQGTVDRQELSDGTLRDGVPVVALVGALQNALEGAGRPTHHLHAGATSQDVLDSALMLVARDVVAEVQDYLLRSAARLRENASATVDALRLARTLGRDAAASTVGVLFARWLDTVSSALEILSQLHFPVQFAGAVGTGEVADRHGRRQGAGDHVRSLLAHRLDLDDPARSWQTDRTPVLVIASACAITCAALGRIGRELTLHSDELHAIIHLSDGGRSSAMPHKQNPVGPIAMAAAAVQAPALLSTLVSAAASIDERPAGDWHATWTPLRSLLRLTLGASSASAAALDSLTVDAAPAARDLERASSIHRHNGDTVAASRRVVDAAIARSHRISVMTRPVGGSS